MIFVFVCDIMIKNHFGKDFLMKFIHLSDLHIGKRFGERPLTEDQEYILAEILKIIDEEQPDGILIAGDIYDKAIPSAEAVQILDNFLFELAERKKPVFIISGNHDSPERLAFGNRLIECCNIHIAPAYDGELICYAMEDEYGEVDVYMLPFVKPSHVRRYYGDDAEIFSYTDAVRTALWSVCASERRKILVTHQFVTGAAQAGSEEISVGGSDNVDASVFDAFDYVALGHIHGPQNCGSERIRYCGTPLKYSFAEAKHEKSVTVVTLGEKGSLDVRTVPLVPKRDVRDIKGSYDEVTAKEFYENTTLGEDYVRVILTDDTDIPDAMNKLRRIYHNIVSLAYDNARTRENAVLHTDAEADRKSPFALFSEFYEKQNGKAMSEEQSAFVLNLLEDLEDKER